MGVEDVKALREGFASRCERMIEAQRGEPFKKAPIDYDWNDRGNFTRKYAHSVTTFAMQALHLNEQVDVANEALQELCQHYLDNPTDLLEAHSFHWSGALYNRLWAFFGETGSVSQNRLDEKTQALLLDVMWHWAEKASPALDPSTDHIWRFPNSENHHAMGIVTTWGFCDVLRKIPAYSDQRFEDDRSAGEHYDAWTAYFKAYFRVRAGKGQSVEIASKSYNAHTIQMWYNLVDFAEDQDLRHLATCFLDLYWVTWAEEQMDGVRGGGKTRIYQGRASRTASGGGVEEMAQLYLSSCLDGKMSSLAWVTTTSSYRMPEEVMALALEVDKRGEYEVIQRCMGLREPGWERIPNHPVVPFGVNGLRGDFGGFLRYSYCTPDFVVGTLMVEPRPNSDWTGVAAQNRWQGVIFRGDPNAAIVPECLAVDTHLNMNYHANTMNQHWSVQKKGTLITQKLACPEFSIQTGDSRVWISSSGLSDPVEASGWVIVQASGAYAGIYVADGGYVWDDPPEDGAGRWLRCNNDLSPIVIEVSRKESFDGLHAFQTALLSRTPSLEEGVLRYEGLDRDSFVFYSDYGSLPEIDGTSIDLTPDKVYDSPHVQSDWDSGVVTVSYGESKRELNFTI